MLLRGEQFLDRSQFKGLSSHLFSGCYWRLR